MSTSLLYDNGNVVDFLYDFFKQMKKDKIFLTCHLEAYIERKEDIEKQLYEYLKRIDIDYVDALQVHVSYAYNLECKYYENVGLIDFCKENNIKFVCYQTLRRNNIAKMNYPFLVELANKYNKTQNQILLNWIIKEKGLNTIIKTNTIENIDSNLQSLDFTLESKEIEILNNFQDQRFNSIEIDWKNQGGITIDKLASQFKVQ